MKNNFSPSGLYRKLYHFVFFSLLSLMVLTSCAQDNITNDTIPDPTPSSAVGQKTMGDLILQKNVIILNDESVSAISSMDNQSITFSRATGQTDSIAIGTVVIGTKINGDEVNNILSKVTSVSKTNNQFIFQTSTAKLEDVIYSGTISGVYDPSGKTPINVNGKMASYVPVEGFASQEANNKILNLESKNSQSQKLITFRRFGFDKTIPLVNQQLGPIGVGSNVNLKGGFTPKIDYKIAFMRGRLTDFQVTFLIDEISLEAFFNVQASLGYTIGLTDFVNIPIAPIILGPTGLILSPTIAAGPYAGVQATGKAQLQFLDIKGSANLHVGVVPSMNVQFNNTIELKVTTLEGDLSAEFGVEAKGSVGLLFTAVPIANSGVRGRVSAVPSIGLQLVPDRKGIIDLRAKIQADMFYGFGVAPFRYEGTFPLLKKEVPLFKRELNF